MHAADGILDVGTSVATGVLSAAAIGVALRQTRSELRDEQVPLAGVSAAFVFAAQMFNFPVLPGVTGHLLGGALAAVLLGPSMGALVVTVVVAIQALAFADGGLTALGYNTLNMAIVTAFGGYAAVVLLRRMLPDSVNGLSAAAGLAALCSVALSSMAFSLEWLFGATAPVSFPTVFAGMVGVHAVIGIGEGAITALAVRSVLAVRPDLVAGARGRQLSTAPTRSLRAFTIGGVVVAFLFATVVAQFAAPDPDGLESVAARTGFEASAQEHVLGSSLFADYATAGIDNQRVSLAVAGGVGTVLTLAVGSGILLAARGGRRKDDERPGTPAAAG